MMLLDVVIDPIAVRGDRWFLGRIFYYVEEGAYFGVPLVNFAGWALVGTLAIGGYLVLTRDARGTRPEPGMALYYAVLAFNLVVTAWIREWVLLGVGRLRQDPGPGTYIEEAPQRRAVPGRGGGVRCADGQHPRRRAAHVPGDRPARLRAGGAPQVRLPLHQRDPPQGEARGGAVHAVEVPVVQRSHGRPARGARRGRVPRGCLRPGGGGDP